MQTSFLEIQSLYPSFNAAQKAAFFLSKIPINNHRDKQANQGGLIL